MNKVDKFENFLNKTSYSINYEQETKKDFDKKAPLLINLSGWLCVCPNCFFIYKQNGKCSFCGTELRITKRKWKNEV